MLSGAIGGLITAFVLSWFKVNIILIEVLQPFVTQVELTDIHYYVAFVLFGIIGGAFRGGL